MVVAVAMISTAKVRKWRPFKVRIFLNVLVAVLRHNLYSEDEQ